MLKVFRENLKYLSWVLWAVIAVFVLFVFVDFGAGVPRGSIGSDAAATVGRYEISYSDFERAYRQAEDFYRRSWGEAFNRDLARQMGLPMQVLDGLVNDAILLDEADRIGLEVTDGELRTYILSLPAFQNESGGFIGEEAYRRILRSNGYSIDGFERAVRTDLLTGKVRDVLSQSVFVSDREVEEAYRESVEKAAIRYVKLSARDFADQVELGSEEVAAYFETHQEDFRVPEQRLVDYLLVDTEEIRGGLEIDSEEIRAYWENNPDEFTEEEQVRARHILLRVTDERPAAEAERQLQEIRTRIEGGESFEKLALELSEDPGSRELEGDLGSFGRGQMIPEFEEAAFSADPGDLVGPISTSFGYHLIRVDERRDGGLRPLEEAEEQIRGQLLGERARSLAESKAQELADRIEREGLQGAEALRTLAETERGVTVHTTPFFGREDNVPGIGRATAFSVTAFELEPDAPSEPVRVGRGWTILQLREIQEPRLPDLEEVRTAVEEALSQERQVELARQRLETAAREVAEGKSLEDLAAELETELQESPSFGRNDPIPQLGPQPGIAAAAFELDEGEVGGPVVSGRDVILFEVSGRQRFDPAAFEQEKESTRQEVLAERFQESLSSLVAQRREELEVRYDPQLLANFETAGQEQT